MIGIHAIAALVILLVPMTILWRLLLLPFAFGSLIRALHMHALRSSPAAVTGIELIGDGCIAHNAQRPAYCRITAQFIHPWIVVLQLAPEGQRRRIGVVIPRDAAQAEAFRALRARLNLVRAAA